MGYRTQYKGYKCLNPIIAPIYITRRARFDENVFPFARSDHSPNIYALDLSTFMEDQPFPKMALTSSLPSPPTKSFQPTNTSHCSPCRPTTPLPDTPQSMTTTSPLTQTEYVTLSQTPLTSTDIPLV